MGPPPFGDGNNHNDDTTALIHLVLQWGHRLSAMETVEKDGDFKYQHGFNGATAFRRWKQELKKELIQTLT